MNFENDEVIAPQIEKLTQRVLFMRYEFEQQLPENKEKPDLEQEWTKTSFNQFLQYFASLSIKN